MPLHHFTSHPVQARKRERKRYIYKFNNSYIIYIYREREHSGTYLPCRAADDVHDKQPNKELVVVTPDGVAHEGAAREGKRERQGEGKDRKRQGEERERGREKGRE